jgi:prepilin-type N-terminal cleavage/methylation domain-containing protein
VPIGTGMKMRLAAEHGFTLLELAIVLAIIAILITIPVASYIAFDRRANDATAQSNVHIVLPSIEAYYADHKTYAGMTLAALHSDYDSAIVPSSYSLTNLGDSSYCVSSSSGNRTWKRQGPGAPIVQGGCG